MELQNQIESLRQRAGHPGQFIGYKQDRARAQALVRVKASLENPLN